MSGKKMTLTAEDILAMSSSDEDHDSSDNKSSSSSHSSADKKKLKEPQKTARSLETTPLAKHFTSPDPEPKTGQHEEEKNSSLEEEGGFEVIEQPIVVNPYINPMTSKSANAVEHSFASRITAEASYVVNKVSSGLEKVTDGITDVLFKKEDAEKDHDSDPEPDKDRPTR